MWICIGVLGVMVVCFVWRDDGCCGWGVWDLGVIGNGCDGCWWWIEGGVIGGGWEGWVVRMLLWLFKGWLEMVMCSFMMLW